MKELMKRLIEVNKSLNESELDTLFPNLAKFFMGNYCIKSKGNKYFINEIEFYFYGANYDDLRINKNRPLPTQEILMLVVGTYMIMALT